MSKYSVGAALERKLKRALEARGIWVFRSAGSRGPADLIACYSGSVALIQCKCGKSRPCAAELERLSLAARAAGGTAWVAAQPPRGRLMLWRAWPADSSPCLLELEPAIVLMFQSQS